MQPKLEPLETPLSPSKLATEVIVAQARALARAGGYGDAESAVSHLSQEDKESVEVLDLLARIRAQQGRIREAEDLWVQLLKLDPRNKGYRRALYRIERLQRRPAWLSLALAVALAVIFAISALVVTLKVRSYFNELENTVRAQPARAAAPHGTAGPASPESASSTWMVPEIQVPGVALQREHRRVAAIFEDGLFQHGVTFRPEGKRALTNLRRQLARYRGSLSIVLVGCSDDVPLRPNVRYRDNIALGMARADAVFNRLTTRAGLRGDIFALRSAAGPPCPANASRRNPRNRTVVIQLLPGQ